MKTLIKSAKILDKKSSRFGTSGDILSEDGVIIRIDTKINDKADYVVQGKDLAVTPGYIDLRASFRDPGAEYKEDLHSGLEAAKAGGFKYVVAMPSTHPVVDNKAMIEYLINKSKHHSTLLLPAGTLSAGMEGKALSEMFDMQSSGAVAFTDDKKSVSTEMMIRALEYCGNIDGLVMSFPFDPGVNPGGLINEGRYSVETGMKGLSNVSEEVRLSRDIDLLRYTGGRLHVSLISTAGSVEKIRKAKKEGLQITCAIAAHQLAFTDADLTEFDSNLKVFPPFRSATDRKALIAGLKDGTIDAICSDHSPEDYEHKVLEFEYASFGISSIQTAVCVAIHHLSSVMSVEDILEKFTHGPASVLRMDYPCIEEGAQLSMTILETQTEQTFGPENWKSKSSFSPFYGKTLKGKIVEVI